MSIVYSSPSPMSLQYCALYDDYPASPFLSSVSGSSTDEEIWERESNCSINTLPDEILEEIFMMCSSKCLWIGHTDEFAWTSTQVCRRWRRVATSLSALWSNIDFTHDRRTDGQMSETECHQRAYEILSIIMERTQDHLLDVTYAFSDPFDSRIVSILLSSSERWRTASLSVDFWGSHPRDLESLHGRLPELRRLSFALLLAFDDIPAIKAFQIVPKLTDLAFAVNKEMDQSHVELLKVPWEQIQRFHIPYPDRTWLISAPPRLIIGLSQLTQNLTVLDISYMLEEAASGGERDLMSIRLPNLLELSISSQKSQILVCLLELPRLVRLRICFPCDSLTRNYDVSEFVYKLRNGWKNVRELRLCGFPEVRRVMQILEAAERIRVLGIIDCDFRESGKSLLDALAISSGSHGGSSSFLPLLEDLRLSGICTNDADRLSRVILARFGQEKSNEHCKIPRRREVRRDSRKWLKLKYRVQSCGSDSDAEIYFRRLIRRMCNEASIQLDMNWDEGGYEPHTQIHAS
ncbi:hypothetical protein M422DRAFT_24119 [Sphaerobolus stellatus SS14]|nr:hypothetical protein M422DRAFT_24119 [Sphaerobolus stellatus SS14]